MTNDGSNSLKYDAENRVTPSTGHVYTYDGDNHRVSNVNGSTASYYWYDDNFNVISTTGTVATRDYVYFNRRRIGYESMTSGNQHYYWSDHLGSPQTITNASGSTIQWDSDYYPFGTKRVLNNSEDNYFLFTGYLFDYELGDYYAENREQSPNLGRFASPDASGGDRSNPQSLNRYSYAGNNPINATDPDGLKTLPDFRLGISQSWYVSAITTSFALGGTIDGLDAPTSLVLGSLSSGAAVQCPNNECGIGTSTPFQCLGNNCGYLSNQYAATHEYDCGGKPCTAQQYNQYLQPYVDSMANKVSATLAAGTGKSVDASNLIPVNNPVKGGNANFSVSGDLESAYVNNSDNGCIPSGSETRCGDMDGSLHFKPDPDTPGNYLVHMDTSNPFADVPGGFFVHFFVDVVGGHTIFQDGVPH